MIHVIIMMYDWFINLFIKLLLKEENEGSNENI